MDIQREGQKQQLEQVQAVRMENLDGDTLNFGSVSGAGNNAAQSDGKKKEKDSHLLQQLVEVSEFLARLDERIEELQLQIDDLMTQRSSALIEAQEAFDRMNEAEDLIADIQDGISPEEQKRLIDLLGTKANGASIEELTLLLQSQYDHEQQLGLDKSEEAELLEGRIAEQQAILDQLKAERNSYEVTSNPNMKQSIEARISPMLEPDELGSEQSAPDAMEQYEAELSDEVNFNVPGL